MAQDATKRPGAPSCILVMGVSGAGKTTIGTLLARRLNGRFLDADSLHPASNVQKMARGEPLNDADRGPWLDRVRAEMAAHQGPAPLVVACSALKKSYRDRLGRGLYELVYLRGGPEVIGMRLAHRKGHFMPPALLDSQLAALEAPKDALVVDVDAPPEIIVERIVAGLDGHG